MRICVISYVFSNECLSTIKCAITEPKLVSEHYSRLSSEATTCHTEAITSADKNIIRSESWPAAGLKVEKARTDFVEFSADPYRRKLFSKWIIASSKRYRV